MAVTSARDVARYGMGVAVYVAAVFLAGGGLFLGGYFLSQSLFESTSPSATISVWAAFIASVAVVLVGLFAVLYKVIADGMAVQAD
ncbi:hypothetical protein [Halorussus lipolyticus]|uniref:hypothetical protein n=1 Tax=Halorussus lipolyticus TaxID=3034024 RepID=UPI0023E86632|nr:hypothetical protein [Halorussus sp. DT80]